MGGDGRIRFIDLFAGLGGFHVGLEKLGHRCVLAAELDPDLRGRYHRNHGRDGLVIHDDVRTLGTEQGVPIPDHELLCGGFPCQPFSKAGEQKGLECEKDGDLFAEILRIIDLKRPRFLMLENVSNLLRHNNEKTFKRMREQLEDRGYDIEYRVLSPDRHGIPQVRQRLFIVGSLGSLSDFRWPEPLAEEPDIRSVLDDGDDARGLPTHYLDVLNIWQEFIERFTAAGGVLPSFPIWSMEFGATYPIDGLPAGWDGRRGLCRYAGSHGQPLRELPPWCRRDGLPSHAKRGTFPRWKQDFLKQNRALYQTHRGWLDRWIEKIKPFPSSLQKLEWNCKGESTDLRSHVLQFRASGIRVKRSRAAPALIAMTSTQVPIVHHPDRWRYMTPTECARLQGLGGLHDLPSATRAFRALGNAVNADLVSMIAEQLLPEGSSDDRVRQRALFATA